MTSWQFIVRVESRPTTAAINQDRDKLTQLSTELAVAQVEIARYFLSSSLNFLFSLCGNRAETSTLSKPS